MLKYIFFILLTATTSKCNQNTSEESHTEEMTKKSTNESRINALHDIWALKEMNGELISEKTFAQGVPTLEIFVADMKLGGFSGCNNYGATIDSLTESSIAISPIMATKKYCFDVDESGFFNNMHRVNTYRIEKMHLLLLENDSLLLTFKKVD